MPEMTVEERLKSIGVSHDRELEDLHVEAGQSIDLDPRNDRFKDHIERLNFDSIRDVKHFMGIPDEAVEESDFQIRPEFSSRLALDNLSTRLTLDDRLPLSRRIPPLVLAMPEVQDASVAKRLYDISAEYVFGSTKRIDSRQIEAVDKWIKATAINIQLFLFRDIFVGKGATLNVKSTALFANHITVENTGRIIFKAGAHSTLHAASFKGL
jgi:hypothetical protein